MIYKNLKLQDIEKEIEDINKGTCVCGLEEYL